MRAICLITVKPGKVDQVLSRLKKTRRTIREIVVVSGRADIAAVLQGTIAEINSAVVEFKRIKEIVSTETMIEVEVNLGW